jgi:hypothetical protein
MERHFKDEIAFHKKWRGTSRMKRRSIKNGKTLQIA